MRLVLGVDPGAFGAIAAYDVDAKAIFQVWDMPIKHERVGASKKPRLDLPELLAIFGLCADLGAELAALEEVGGLPRQSATHAFTFGWTTGCTYTALIASRIATERVRPALWKRLMNCGKEDAEIYRRACELFPGEDQRWQGARGGVKDGRCEAAMLALFAANHFHGRNK